jgi:ABC-2 type transport system permease protein
VELFTAIRNRYRYSIILLRQLVITDFKLRYQGSVLGYAWSLLRPLMLFLILYMVFVRFLKIGGDTPHYPIYLLLGIVIWSFFAEMTSHGLESIVGRGELIRKIPIPRWTIVVSTSISALINLVLNLFVVAIFMLFNQVDLSLTALWLPLILLEVYLFALGVSLFLAAAFVRYRDITYIWEVILQAAFYLTPILYPLSLVKDRVLQKLIILNPMAQAIQDARHVLVTPSSITISESFGTSFARLLPLGFSLLVLVGAITYFRRNSKYFAENI